ncbi:MAG: hypothetical protein HQ472_07800 [Ignavibacteria bacterium]|nr:hypothetical protein [Ignavibacteria bacterium]
MTKSSIVNYTVIGATVLIAVSRVIPHWPNFTPVMAVALLGGAIFGAKRYGFIIPLAAMVLSDLLLGLVMGWEYAFHDTQIVVYGLMAVIYGMGVWMRNDSPVKLVFGGGTAAAVLFFLVTNAAVWMFGSMYPHNLSGLMMSYSAGLAFYRDGGNFLFNAIASTWLFSGLVLVARAMAIRVSESTAQ